jgi:repressor LexA
MIGTILKNLLDQQGINVNELSRRTDIPAQTLYSIIRRDNMKTNLDILLKICAAMNVPIELFYRDCFDSQATQSPNAEELGLLSKYRELDDYGRRLARLVIDAEAERLHAESSVSTHSPAKVIPLYTTPAAAGYAAPVLGEDFEEYEVPADSRADFAAHIQGDSMEPYIADGSVVLVSRRLDLIPGDVGLFFVDGDMYCKQYCEDSEGNIYLFSLNRARKDADKHIWASSGQTVCCFGKVLLERRPPLPRD